MTAPLFLLDPDHDDSPLASDELHTGWRLTLPEHIRRHALGSIRLKNGDQLELSDGDGLRISALVRDASTGLVEVTTVGRQAPPEKELILVQALAKGGKDEQAIDMATQIGVDQVMPWQADRSIAKWRPGSSVAIVVGPEGGIADQEIQGMMRQGALPVRLGGNILRAALAGPVALTLLADMLGRWQSEAPELSA